MKAKQVDPDVDEPSGGVDGDVAIVEQSVQIASEQPPAVFVVFPHRRKAVQVSRFQNIRRRRTGQDADSPVPAEELLAEGGLPDPDPDGCIAVTRCRC